jgi:chromosome segregation ATPase
MASEPPIYEHAGFRAIEEQRQDAERRSRALEENFQAVQKRLKDVVAQNKELEGRLAMNETQNSTNDGELQALRDQLRKTSERLHETELDNNALRERMSLRQQELDESRRMLVEVRGGSEAPELRMRLEAAERRTEELLQQVERLEGELEYTTTKFHMTKFSEALRGFQQDDLEIEEEDDLFEHPVVIRNTPGQPSHEKVR